MRPVTENTTIENRALLGVALAFAMGTLAACHSVSAPASNALAANAPTASAPAAPGVPPTSGPPSNATAHPSAPKHSVSAGVPGFDAPFLLELAQSVALPNSDLKITFKKVTEDSRCPQNATCVWAGQVTVAVQIEQGGHDLGEHLLTLRGTGNIIDKSITQAGPFWIELTGVAPYPRVPGPDEKAPTEKVPPSMTLVVSKSKIEVPTSGRATAIVQATPTVQARPIVQTTATALPASQPVRLGQTFALNPGQSALVQGELRLSCSMVVFPNASPSLLKRRLKVGLTLDKNNHRLGTWNLSVSVGPMLSLSSRLGSYVVQLKRVEGQVIGTKPLYKAWIVVSKRP